MSMKNCSTYKIWLISTILNDNDSKASIILNPNGRDDYITIKYLYRIIFLDIKKIK